MPCYVDYQNSIRVNTLAAPCATNVPGFSQCCHLDDECLPNGFCHFTHELSGNVTGFYTGGCTDPKFLAPQCIPHCKDCPTSDVVYNATNGLWACCYGSGSLIFNDPSNETFYDSAPSKLLAAASGASTTSSVATRRPSVHTPSPSSSSQSTINTSTVILATVIPVVALLLGLSLGFWWCIRKRYNGGRNSADPRAEHQTQNNVGTAEICGYHSRTEMSTDRKGAEVDGVPVGELGGRMKQAEIAGVPVSELEVQRTQPRSE